jgi:hypothetical protein
MMTTTSTRKRAIDNPARFAECDECSGDGRGYCVVGDQERRCILDCASCRGSGIAMCPLCLDRPTFDARQPCLVCAAELAADVWRWGGFAAVPAYSVDVPLAGPVVKQCSCGLSYSRDDWTKLRPAGGDTRSLCWFDGEVYLEMRLCRACRSTMAIEVPAPDAEDLPEVHHRCEESEDRP